MASDRFVSFHQQERTLGTNGRAMDLPRKGQKARKWRRRIFWVLGIASAAVGIAVFLAKLKPALFLVDRSSVWMDTVSRGPLVRDVRGIGTLVPEDIRWLPARTDARVERILVWPGTTVGTDTVVLELTNEDLVQQSIEADSAIAVAQAKLKQLEAELESERLDQESVLTKARADRDIAAADLAADERLAKGGLIASLDLQKAEITAQQLVAAFLVQQERTEFTQRSRAPRLALAQAELDNARAKAELRHEDVSALKVRASMPGVLQQIAVEVGQRVTTGTNLARVADPHQLKVQVKIPETQARDIALGQTAAVDFRNGTVVTGTVSRVDSAVTAGTVLVDISFPPDSLPRGARPDLGVEGTIEIEHLADVTYLGRPAFGQDESVVNLYRVDPQTGTAIKVKVRLGRGSATKVVIDSGLSPGDQVILSDSSAFDAHEIVQLK